MIWILTTLACDGDPCTWAYGDWTQVETVRAGEAISTPGGALSLAPAGFGYRPEGDAPLEPAVLTPMDPACESLNIVWSGQEYLASQAGERLVLTDGPARHFSFERAN